MVHLFFIVAKGLDASHSSCLYAAQACVYMVKPVVTLQLLAQLCKEDAVVPPEVFHGHCRNPCRCWYAYKYTTHGCSGSIPGYRL